MFSPTSLAFPANREPSVAFTSESSTSSDKGLVNFLVPRQAIHTVTQLQEGETRVMYVLGSAGSAGDKTQHPPEA